jgi:cytochrome c-type biogenesis protein CcmE
MRRRGRYLVAAVVTVAAMTTVLVGTLQASVPFVGPGQLDAGLDGRRVQVEGMVERVTLETDHLRLEVSDGSASVEVIYAYAEHRPLTLATGRIVVAKGQFRDGIVHANQVSVRAHEQ